MPPAIALATVAGIPYAAEHDRPLVEALRARGVAAERVIWNDPAADWALYGLVIVRSTWDYDRPDRIEAFRAWIDHVAARTQLWNPPDVLRWNLDKRYLRDLARRGVAVPETEWLERGADATLAAILNERGWREAVVKPVVSASARETYRVHRDDVAAAERTFARNLAREAMMVQAFVPEVVAWGELSVIVIDGVVTHAVRKRPAPGDFRVQIEHGGSETRVELDAPMIQAAERVLRAVEHDGPLPYARVDLVPRGAADVRAERDAGPIGDERSPRDAEALLLELELVEPSLFLDLCPEAAERLADAAVAAVGVGGAT